MQDLHDAIDRPLRDLRFSVIDRCNFRCEYCMPKEVFDQAHPFLPKADLLTYEEIERLARIFVALGVRKIRLTGGEPLMRRDIERLVRMLASLGRIEVALTTNGSLLEEKAQALRDAGLARVTVSLDSLENVIFGRMNGVGFPVERVIRAMDRAYEAGLRPLKVNMVVRRGINEDCIVPMAAFFRDRGYILRFIEYMDVGGTNGWRRDDVVPADEIVRVLSAAFPAEPAGQRGDEVAQRWRYVDGKGEFGVIGSVTQPFCRECTRARLTAKGELYTCLFAARGTDLRALLRGGARDGEIAAGIADAWRRRADRYSELRTEERARRPRVEMSYIGG